LQSAWDSFRAVCRFWPPCHLCNRLCTWPMLFNYLTSTILFIPESFSGFILLQAGSSPGKVRLQS
jgi:hypothetical protein